ncbi:G-alpha-domain-containing protein [Sparassis crispa]|uniref:G-alpha-domain-containing protein n=1 Tax=Sparassis crispa TaxID=139825 RepID=A0A401H4G1_9APHY|nr:G-alpha-domain-containing protein [Sparassis crispa]GBE89336.1 G-alpha-domain-containing protein [Sparassis crispa]
MITHRFSDPDDPLSRAIAPPANETAEECTERLAREAHAQHVSDEIDEELLRDHLVFKKNKGMFKLLLLGQSESGKSTTLKNLQLTFAPQAWQVERTSWRAVIQLNLVRSVNAILDVLAEEMAPPARGTGPYGQTLPTTPYTSLPFSSVSRPLSQTQQTPPQFTPMHALLKLRLAPLRRVEADLKQLLGAATGEVPGSPASTIVSLSQSIPNSPVVLVKAESADAPQQADVFVRSHRSWRDALQEQCKDKSRSPPGGNRREQNRSGDMKRAREMLDDATEILAGCREDMRMLWDDSVVRAMLRRRRLKLEETPGFFLDDIDRISQRGYQPSDDDVLRARLRTVGVQEYSLVFEDAPLATAAIDTGGLVSKEWIIYDVGGTRTSRAAWVPYFEDANAIIFLAPISCFDELLAEDRSVNRLEDSFALWKSVVGSKLLARSVIILFLNKYDLLQAKLGNGVKVNKSMPSFGDRQNTAPVVAKYLYQKFREQYLQLSPEPRTFYGYLTSVVDAKATASTLASVRDGIFRQHLKEADLV